MNVCLYLFVEQIKFQKCKKKYFVWLCGFTTMRFMSSLTLHIVVLLP